MAEHRLATYLNDHLSGSVAAIELLDHLRRLPLAEAITRFATGLKAEIEADRGELETLMSRLEVAESRPRQAAAWVSEKLTRLKLSLDDRKDGPLRQLEVWEAVSLGIEGKRLLWRSLAAAAETEPGLGILDYARLIRRAEEQRDAVEPFRVEAARMTLAGDGPVPEY
ncbi:hypothetical protein OJF2_49190 [Aquisphaera giovannonii]|uniref:Uncharacterized protein n=1 Tax=Aquisphaera giovannonii TaxID=406548 RepID=A0A5B9W708_9BACT|nr:hypothetical protein [Aquisphaera giovannonii]QEH36358.1 hypothetical protein OJF2_49190 [Aquisphaera giovannonii]